VTLLFSAILAAVAGLVVSIHTTHGGARHLAPPPAVPGHWKLVFHDEFNGTSLDRTVWNEHDGWANQNNVTDYASNITVKDGHAILTLASPTSGAEISTDRFLLQVGDYAEARIEFAGSGSTIYNWPAFWTSGPNWPAGGENDVAEGFGNLTVNYHSPSLVERSGPIAGNWAGSFHTYGVYRGRGFARVYWDGRPVRTYRTADDGQPQSLLLTLGASDQTRTGPAGAMVVDYVRVWAPA
jgi:beta-glucanase (GH16 family)